MSHIRHIADSLADLLWPPRCGACSAIIEEEDTTQNCFCAACTETLVFATSPLCSMCGLPFGSTGPNHLCSGCLKEPPAFDRARALLLYGGAAAQALTRLKYARVPGLAKPLGKMLSHLTSHMPAPDVVIPVPLHPTRLRTRGFNQSALLAAQVASTLKAPFLTNALVRTRNTPSQADMNRQQRFTNLKNAFWIRQEHRILDRHVLLVDDVITTTATIREAASILVRAGAQYVGVAALARAPDPTLPYPQKR
ncbi:MAG: ComF family protein [Proteobacteria bacterium]|nr:ComF family protein [Pseudomonadota bacterium]